MSALSRHRFLVLFVLLDALAFKFDKWSSMLFKDVSFCYCVFYATYIRRTSELTWTAAVEYGIGRLG